MQNTDFENHSNKSNKHIASADVAAPLKVARGHMSTDFGSHTASPRTKIKILDFRGFDSSIILIVSGGILAPMGDFPEISNQGILAEIILVGRFDVSSQQ